MAGVYKREKVSEVVLALVLVLLLVLPWVVLSEEKSVGQLVVSGEWSSGSS